MGSPRTADESNTFGGTYVPGQAGIVIRCIERRTGRVEAAMSVHRGLMAPNDRLHGGAIMVLADTAAAYGAIATLPGGMITCNHG